MFNISKRSEDRLDLELSGVLDSDAMRNALDAFIEQAEGIQNGKMLYKILDFEMPTMGALAVELQHLPKLFGVIGKFERCAVLSDVSWIRTAAEIEGALIPSLTIKSFPLSAAAAAEEWLEGSHENDDSDGENVPV
ncbi:SpoIIAA family protein [Roseobacter sinensis]|uniref:STAS/SEC14 domain-containing protein n=1 Tax=Roseobacter sinensis TaxID=2931391 RepID=A0ABT3BD55_9RHOB|nr:STAS/SEC14 domain-containing protein [Roseobacter sp. WL0113]MCV3271507.1 STAS/SEC14 domain-containing protein [Roseobacter sp. WL0113]